MRGVTKEQARSLIGQKIYVQHKDGTIVSGKLLEVKGNRLVLEPGKGKKVKTKAIIPLVLFDLLAIGTAPFAFGGFGGYGGYGGGYPYGGGNGYSGYGGPGSYGGYYGGYGYYR